MAASVAATTKVVQQSNQALAKAAKGWDPIGEMIFNKVARDSSLMSNAATKVAKYSDPIGHATLKPVAKAGEQISKNLDWIPKTVNKVGLAGDEGIRQIGLNPDQVKLAISGAVLTVTGQAWAIPLVSAALTKARGGSWGDVALSAGTAYVAQYAGGMIGDYVSGGVTGGVPVTPGQVAAQYGIDATSKQAMTIAAQNAAALGAQAGAGVALGGIAGATGASGLNNMATQLVKTGKLDINKTLDAMKDAAVSGGISAAVNVLTNQIPGWKSLDKPTQNVIRQGASGLLAGKNLDAMAMTLATNYITGQLGEHQKQIFDTAKAGYDVIANKFSELGTKAAEYLLPSRDTLEKANEMRGLYEQSYGQAKSVYDSYNQAKDQTQSYASQYESKANAINTLIEQYNASGDANILAQINSGKTELTNIEKNYLDWANKASAYANDYSRLSDEANKYSTSYEQLSNQYNTQVSEFEKQYNPEYSGLTNELIDKRNQMLKASAQYIDPNFDEQAYLAQLDPETKAKYPNATAAEIFINETQANPQGKFLTNWDAGILNASPDKLDDIGALYKSTTGRSLDLSNIDSQYAGVGVDPYTFSLYKEKVEGSVPWYMEQAQKALDAGDFTAYAEAMRGANALYGTAFGENQLGVDDTANSTSFFKNIGKAAFGSQPTNQKPTINLGWFNPQQQQQQQQQQQTRPQPVYRPGVQPQVPQQSDPKNIVTTYGFGQWNPFLSDLMKTNEGKNMFLRDSYTYDKNAVDQRLGGMSMLNFQDYDQSEIDALLGNMGTKVVAGKNVFLPSAAKDSLLGAFNLAGNSGYNNIVSNKTALDYLKEGAPGGLGSYVAAYSNPYAPKPTNTTSPGGLSQVANKWASQSNTVNPQVRSALANKLI